MPKLLPLRIPSNATLHLTRDPLTLAINSEMDDSWHAYALTLVVSLLNPLACNYLWGEQRRLPGIYYWNGSSMNNTAFVSIGPICKGTATKPSLMKGNFYIGRHILQSPQQELNISGWSASKKRVGNSGRERNCVFGRCYQPIYLQIRKITGNKKAS